MQIEINSTFSTIKITACGMSHRSGLHHHDRTGRTEDAIRDIASFRQGKKMVKSFSSLPATARLLRRAFLHKEDAMLSLFTGRGFTDERL